ncbi:MAG: hypothetical protein KatS3mg109_1094 [Pirellulaceae bacterium]|nr:MAG: hypothetical protein KatS3mg109_1094 [Pirellulaceae bacterium]GIW93657.1 MAG: hypothetical protein KatS3mg110_1698 [Pirellulaceae bacterium]
MRGWPAPPPRPTQDTRTLRFRRRPIPGNRHIYYLFIVSYATLNVVHHKGSAPRFPFPVILCKCRAQKRVTIGSLPPCNVTVIRLPACSAPSESRTRFSYRSLAASAGPSSRPMGRSTRHARGASRLARRRCLSPATVDYTNCIRQHGRWRTPRGLRKVHVKAGLPVERGRPLYRGMPKSRFFQ